MTSIFAGPPWTGRLSGDSIQSSFATSLSPRPSTTPGCRWTTQGVLRRKPSRSVFGGASRATRLPSALRLAAVATDSLNLPPLAAQEVNAGSSACPPLTVPTYVKATGRIIAIGDIHGDLRKAISSLELCGVLREQYGRPCWCGGDTVVVQMGDVLDRGDNELAVIMLLRELNRQAQLQGGAVYMLNGNHESLNVCGNFRYVTPGGFLETAMAAGLREPQLRIPEWQKRARNSMFMPGGMLACELAKNPTVLVVNETVFAHGGLLPAHVKYGLETINREVSQWMRGERMPDGSCARPPFIAMGNATAVMWNRSFSVEKFDTAYQRFSTCGQLKQTLRMIGARHMVVGHTPQKTGCNCECDGRVWRIDVGMSSGVFNSVPQVLEISENEAGQAVTCVLTSPTMYTPNSLHVAKQGFSF